MATKNEGTPVKPNDVVEIEYTQDLSSNKKVFIKAGKKATVHKVQAEKLIAKGVAKYPGAKLKEGGK